MGKQFQKTIKRIIDIVSSVVVLSFFLPFFMVIAVLIKSGSRGPVFFRYKRVGKDGRLFVSYKFRSMIEDAVSIGLGIETGKDDPRVTIIGEFLRRWSLDEVPQLINVFKGEMSIVGPRPALPHQVEKYSKFEKRRLRMKPGITGWAQINGRNLLSWKDRIVLDVWYVENWSLCLDFKILLMTPGVILSGQGIYGKGGIVKDYE